MSKPRIGLSLVALAVVIVAAGALPAHASIVSYSANLDGPSESPPNASPATGFAEVDYNNVAHTLRVQVSFSGLLGTTTASHIHAATASPGTGTAGVATTTPTFAGFPLGVTSGTYDNTLDLTMASSWNPSYVTANGGTTASAEAALAAGMAAGEAYLNIHTTVFPSGEIRGFLVQVPTPGSLALLGVAGLGVLRRRERSA
jgi:MYXO-CTERM domain-containing protein